MALKVLMLRKKLSCLQKDLDEIRKLQDCLVKREAELEAAIAEAETEEEEATVAEEVEKFETEKSGAAEKAGELERQIGEIEREIEELEAEQPADPEPTPEPAPAATEERTTVIERSTPVMINRAFKGMNAAEVRSMIEREEVQSFLTEVRTAIRERRSVSGADLTVPEVILGLIRENIIDYSKLYKHVYVRVIRGDGRVVVMGAIPEAVWTDCCGNLNELTLNFNDAEFGCWKVGGYFDICNANLEDSDFDLAAELIRALGAAIGYALDKAIIFGLGTRMPLGIFTRLAQTSEPADYPATARTWVDLHTSNILTIASAVEGKDLFAAIALDFAAASGKYSRGEKVFVMNGKTYAAIVANAAAFDASGAIVASVNGQMPVVGGIIEVLDFIPDDVIIGGYFDLYTLVDRAGVRLERSEHAMFLQDRTVFRGVGRYDGQAVIAEGFVAIGIDGTTPDATGITFAPDTANASA